MLEITVPLLSFPSVLPGVFVCLHLKLVSAASECSWSDALVELQVWCQLAAFCHEAEEHRLLLRSIDNAAMLEEAAAKSLLAAPFALLV